MKIGFFGKMADMIGREVDIDASTAGTVAGLRSLLASAFPDSAQHLLSPALKVCVDDSLADDGLPLTGRERVEFLPPPVRWLSVAGDVRLSPDRFDAASEFHRFSDEGGGEGAIASFTGVARPANAQGDALQALFLDHHPRLTLASMEAIAGAARQRFAVLRLRIVHRCGEVAPGDAIVFVAAASRHRRDALEAVDYMMDRLKTDAVFWKREDRDGESAWIEPSEADRAARARWGVDGAGN